MFYNMITRLGEKMKNPETDAISGFCCELLYRSAEKERAERLKTAQWAVLAKEPG